MSNREKSETLAPDPVERTVTAPPQAHRLEGTGSDGIWLERRRSLANQIAELDR